MLKNVTAIGAVCLLSVTASLAANETDDKKASSKESEEITCKYTKVLGSRIAEKVCMTNFEWEERRRVQMENKRSSRNNNSACGAEGPC